MTTKRRRTAADYEAAADSYEAEPIRPDELRGPIELGPALRMGRPTKGTPSAGKTPTVSVRLDPKIRRKVRAIADGGGVKESEIVRRAVIEYIENHTA